MVSTVSDEHVRGASRARRGRAAAALGRGPAAVRETARRPCPAHAPRVPNVGGEPSMAQGRPGGLRGQGGKAAGVLGNSPDIRRVGVHKFAGVWGSERAPVVPGGESLGFVEFCIQPHVVQCMLMVNRGSDVKERDHGR